MPPDKGGANPVGKDYRLFAIVFLLSHFLKSGDSVSPFVIFGFPCLVFSSLLELWWEGAQATSVPLPQREKEEGGEGEKG